MELPDEQVLLPTDRERSTVSSLRKGLLLVLVLGLYICAGMSTIPLQSQYVVHRLLQKYLNATNVTTSHSSACSNTTVQDIDILNRVQKEAIHYLLLFSISGSVPAVVMNLFYGSYSDYLGRKMLFFMPICGDLINYSIYAAIMKFDLDLNIFYIGSVISGLFGSFTTIILAGFAYTADITHSKGSRTIGIAIIEAILSVGASVGSLMTGYLISSLGFFYPALIITIIVAVDLVIVVLFLPETLQKVDHVVLSPLVHIKKIFGFFTINGTKLKRVQYNLCLLVIVLALANFIGRTNIETLYQLDMPFCWSSVKIGYFGALRILLTSTFSIAMIKILQPHLRDEFVAILGMCFAAGSLVLEAFSTTDLMMYMVPLLAAASGPAIPIFRSIASRMTSPKEQGAIFASIAALETMSGILFVSMSNSIYEATIATRKGTVFLVMSAFSVLSIIVIIIFMLVSRGAGAANLQCITTLDVNSEHSSVNAPPANVDEQE